MGWKDVISGPQHWSASSLSMYTRCAKQFEYRYIKGLKRPPNLSMVLGTSVHKSAEVNYAHKLKTKKAVRLSVALDAYDTAFADKKHEAEKVSRVMEGAEKDRGYAMAVAHYEDIAPMYQPVEKPEFEFSVAVPGVKRKLYGFIDLIASPIVTIGNMIKKVQPKRYVRDTKTSGRKFDKFAVEVSSQLTAYAYAHQVLFGKAPDGVGLDVVIAKKGADSKLLKSGQPIEVQRETTVRTPGEIKQFIEATAQIEKGMQNGVFPPVLDPKVCGWCGYRDICIPAASKRSTSFSWK